MSDILIRNKLYMVFDVESIGLYGEGFAVGWSVIDATGEESETGCFACDPLKASGSSNDRDWVDANVPVPQSGYNCNSPREVRDAFWEAWLRNKKLGALLVADCGWPVEAQFLLKCLEDDPQRMPDGPYPFHELSTFMQMVGIDPMIAYHRSARQLPKHDPLADARQSADLLVNAFKALYWHLEEQADGTVCSK